MFVELNINAYVSVQNWERCEKGINASIEKLKVFKMKLSMPLPDNHEELHSEQIRCKVRTIRYTGIRFIALILLRYFVHTDKYALAFVDSGCLAIRISRQTGGKHLSDHKCCILSCGRNQFVFECFFFYY